MAIAAAVIPARRDLEAAIHRRLYEELGLPLSLHFLFKFQYSAIRCRRREHAVLGLHRALHGGQHHTNEIVAWRWSTRKRSGRDDSQGRELHSLVVLVTQIIAR